VFVRVTNVTDGPGKTPSQVPLYRKVLAPGEAINMPVELVTEKVRALANAGVIVIGPVPSWYAAAKAKKGQRLAAEDKPKNGHNHRR